MPIDNISISGLESYQPAIDYRRTGRVGVLSGRNFAWDASGVFSAYASRLIAGSSSISGVGDIVQELDLNDMIHVVANNKVYRLLTASQLSPVGTWQLVTTLAQLVAPIPNDALDYNYLKWTSAYLGGKRFACRYHYGVYEITAGSPPVYTRLTSGNTPGFVDDTDPVIAIGESNGRMIYLTKKIVFWSAPADPKNLTPSLGGAGFQVIAERIGGTPIALLTVASGALIFTTDGILVMEFIGGDLVWRWWTQNSEAQPVSAFSITKLPDETYIILTRLGLFAGNNFGLPSPITPQFNEFMREYLRSHETERGHCWYSIIDNRLYIGFRGLTTQFLSTLALDMTIDRWGIFSKVHLGMVRYGLNPNQLGYFDRYGRGSYLLSSSDRRKDVEDADAPGTFIGTDSEILIGWIRTEQLNIHADMIQEMQSLLVNRAIPYDDVSVVYVDEWLLTDPITSTISEGLLTDTNPSVFDEGLVTDRASLTKYGCAWLSDIFDGIIGFESVAEIQPLRAVTNKYFDVWVAMQPARYHRIRFTANAADEYFRVNSLNVDMSYMGQQI